MRKRAIVLAISLLGVMPLHAAITGVVMNAEGKPIAGAKLEVLALETLDAARARLMSATPDRKPLTTGETDAKGRFSLESPKDAVVNLRVSANGYAPEMYRVERDEEAGALALRTAAVKTGRVTASGKPVAGAKVIWTGAGEMIATTDAEGRYAVADPARWAGGVTVIHPDYAFLDDTVFRVGTPNTSPDRSLSAGVSINGIVYGEDGKTPVAGATVIVDGWPLATSGDDGKFTMAHVPAKWQTVTARSGSLSGTRARGTTTSTLSLRLSKTASFSTAVREVKTGAAITFAELRLRSSMRNDPSETAMGFTDAKGNLTLTGVLPGTYQVIATRPGYSIATISTALHAGDKVSKPLLGTRLAVVSGTVIDEAKRPVAAARLNSEIVTRGEGNFMTMGPARANVGTSAPDGTFVLRAEPETDVQVQAVKKGYPSARSTRLRLTPGERKTGVVLTIPSGIAVSGRVMDKNGKPLRDVTVVAEQSSGYNAGGAMRRLIMGGARERNDELIKTAEDGTFTLRVKEGAYDLAFKREGFAMKSVRAIQVNSALKPMEVTLEPGVEISGRVTRGGTAVEGVRIMVMTETSGNESTETGVDGSFRISDLTPGPMMLNAIKDDEFIQQIKPVTAPASDVNIEIPAGVRVSGRVIDKESKQPVRTFQAGVSTPRGGGGMMFMMPPSLRSFTSDDGTFVLENVPPGQTDIVVNAAGYTTGRVSNVKIEENKPLTDIEVAMEPGVRVAGKVTNAQGSAIGGVVVRLDPMAGRAMRGGPMGPAGAVTDANGEYTIEALESGEKTFTFSRSGYVTTKKTANLSGKETRIDAELSSGLRISGVVVTEAGAPVADAGVNALPAGQSGFATPNTVTDSNGAFSFEGLTAGHYNFIAAKRGLATAELRDIDISSGAPVRLTMKTGGTIYGHVSGLSPNELQGATVTANAQGAIGTSAPVDASGSYRLEGAPIGTVRVSARTGMGMSGGKSSPVQSVQVEAGNSVQVDIAFKSDTVVRGRVTRDGRAVDSAMVAFFPKGGLVQTSSRSSTNANGEYEISGLDDATYNVQVVDIQRSAAFSATYEVRGSGTFDIDMKAAALRGRVMDSDGNAVADAFVDLRAKGDSGGGRMFMRAIQTDAAGSFLVENVPPGTYSVSAEKDGYGARSVDTTVADSGGDVQITLTKAAGVNLKVIDGRDGRTLSARVRITDAQNATVYDTAFLGGRATLDTMKLPLEPGTYRAAVWASGYASQTVTLTSPSSQTVALTPGGTLVIQSKGSTLRRARLRGADGREYSRFGDAAATFPVDPSPGVTTLNNIAAGAYTLQILGDENKVTATTPVTIVDGQTVTVSI